MFMVKAEKGFISQTAIFILHFKSTVAPIDLTPREITKIKKPQNALHGYVFTGDPGQIRTADLPLRSFNNIKINVFMCNIPSFYAEFCCIMRKFCKPFHIFSIHSIRISPYFVLRFLYYFLYVHCV